jgi:hypothetical protein
VDKPSLRKNGSTRCKHDYPIVVVATDSGGKRARCLGCNELGPEGEDAEQARQRLVGLPKRRSRWEVSTESYGLPIRHLVGNSVNSG